MSVEAFFDRLTKVSLPAPPVVTMSLKGVEA